MLLYAIGQQIKSSGQQLNLFSNWKVCQPFKFVASNFRLYKYYGRLLSAAMDVPLLRANAPLRFGVGEREYRYANKSVVHLNRARISREVSTVTKRLTVSL